MAITKYLDPVRQEVENILERLNSGEIIDRRVERKHLDLKEEAGRRGREGIILPGKSQNESAAKHLAGEAACMANTRGGGALIVGIADDGELIGTQLDHEWLRRRIYEHTQRKLTVDIQQVEIRSVRLLVIISPTALEPIRWQNKIHWRVDDSCVEIDAATWHQQRMSVLGYDWSAEISSVSSKAVRPQALAIIRDSLRNSGDASSADLAEASDLQLLRRLGAIDASDMLSHAGRLLFVGRDTPALHYIYRDYAGGDSLASLRKTGISLAEELDAVFVHMDARIPVSHIHGGQTIGQVRDIPRLAAREAVINGIAHREWGIADPTVIEQIHKTLKVTSPGGFYGGVNAQNILTHPSTSRNRALTQLLADVRLAEREGIGVDRMVAEMIRVGHQPPEIQEIAGPYVRTLLIGNQIDEPWIRWLGTLNPPQRARDVNLLLVLRTIIETGWIDAHGAQSILQTLPQETLAILLQLEKVQCEDQPLLQRISGTPPDTEPAWGLSESAYMKLAHLDATTERARVFPSRKTIASSYARSRGRISSTELGSILNVSATNVGSILKTLTKEGQLTPSSPSGRGQGFHYRWAQHQGSSKR